MPEAERAMAVIRGFIQHRSSEIVQRLRRGVFLVFGAPCQLRWLAGQEHDRTIPLEDIANRNAKYVEASGAKAKGGS